MGKVISLTKIYLHTRKQKRLRLFFGIGHFKGFGKFFQGLTICSFDFSSNDSLHYYTIINLQTGFSLRKFCINILFIISNRLNWLACESKLSQAGTESLSLSLSVSPYSLLLSLSLSLSLLSVSLSLSIYLALWAIVSSCCSSLLIRCHLSNKPLDGQKIF